MSKANFGVKIYTNIMNSFWFKQVTDNKYFLLFLSFTFPYSTFDSQVERFVYRQTKIIHYFQLFIGRFGFFLKQLNIYFQAGRHIPKYFYFSFQIEQSNICIKRFMKVKSFSENDIQSNQYLQIICPLIRIPFSLYLHSFRLKLGRHLDGNGE